MLDTNRPRRNTRKPAYRPYATLEREFLAWLSNFRNFVRNHHDLILRDLAGFKDYARRQFNQNFRFDPSGRP